MKVRAYLRVAKLPGWKYKIAASGKPDNSPLHKMKGYRGDKEFLPTVAFALDLDIPDEQFNRASRLLGEVVVRGENSRILTDLVE